jgi:hypothetical protein
MKTSKTVAGTWRNEAGESVDAEFLHGAQCWRLLRREPHGGENAAMIGCFPSSEMDAIRTVRFALGTTATHEGGYRIGDLL